MLHPDASQIYNKFGGEDRKTGRMALKCWTFNVDSIASSYGIR
jgi:hypothetical protein